ncbi:MAG: hypothetical protein R3194_10925 [Limnobacter sp.]|nr:hypothetical protein [Limnobacter sp.]
MKVTAQSFEGSRKILNGLWVVVPAYLILSLFMPFLLALALLLAVLHLAEIPLALAVLRKKSIPLTEKISKTFLYGFTYWLPKSLEA